MNPFNNFSEARFHCCCALVALWLQLTQENM